ncbi:CPBP family intramembrane glutamic endopeptidase [Devosia sp.]|uniref:CPBP family intramembrane glutamic endopeptidase n=1 Tax=Devosia sp. TaxID=1871048 RepID=UPI001B1423E3|nr:CPBP family intramembrane glutamic endopeptidase [Devosia sp.]MBO9587674.1 CPBP family intramembrane metalloprotease [Devosia sp.]
MTIKIDLPYYAGEPVAIGGRGWLLVIASVIVAFFQLILAPFETVPLVFIPAVVFTGLPLLTIMAVTGWRPPAIFRPLGLKQFGIGIGFGVLTVLVSGIFGIAISQLFGASPNAAVEGLATYGAVDLLLFLARTFIQLIGEEAVSILPLLAVLWLCVTKFGLSRRLGLIIAVVVSTLWFSAMHLPTYNWNFIQCIGIIGTARIVLTIAYLVTRNLWVSSIAHIFNDWVLFLTSFTLGHLPVGVEA